MRNKMKSVIALCCLSLFAGFTARAENLVYPIPSGAIVASMMNAGETTQLLASGLRISLDVNQTAIIIETPGLPTRTVELFQTVRKFEIIGNFVIAIVNWSQESRRETYISVHLPTGRREVISVLKNHPSRYFGNLNKTPYFVTGEQLLVADGRDGSYLKIRLPAEEKVNATNDNFIKLELLKLYVMVREGKKHLTLPWSGDPLYSCDDHGTFVSCIARARRVIFQGLNPGFDSVKDHWLAYDEKKNYALVCANCTSAHTDIDLKNLKLFDPKTQTHASVNLRFRNEDQRLVMIRQGEGGLITVWLKNGDRLEMTPEDFWSAIEKSSGDELLRKAKKTGRFTRTPNGVISELSEREPARTAWEITAAGSADRYFRRKEDHSDRIQLPDIGSSISVESSEGDYAIVSGSNGRNRTYVLADLKARKFYALGYSPERLPVFSKDGKFILITNGNTQTLYALDQFRSARTRPGRPLQAARGAVTGSMLENCGAEASGSLSQQLLSLRNQESATTYEALQEILRYQLGAEESALLAQVMQTYILYNPQDGKLAFRKLNLYSRLEKYSAGFKINPCLTNFDELAILTHIRNDLRGSNGTTALTADFQDVQHLLVYAPFMVKAGLNTTRHEEELSDKLARGAEQHPQLQNVFFSKLHYFARAAIAPIFGRRRPFKTDVTVTMEENKNVGLLLSTFPTTGFATARNAHGFYHATFPLEKVDVNQASHATSVTWASLGQRFRADVDLVKTGDLRETVPPTASIDHASLRKDGRVVGMMVVGTNMGAENSLLDVISNYMQFYRQRGYQFKGQVTTNFTAMLEDKITSGELDYFLKEAHSDGDEKNLFRAGKYATIMHGTKQGADGVVEEIYLVSPSLNSAGRSETDELIANEKFGEWIRAREKGGASTLIYINSSCNSVYKAIREITSAKSKNLIVIPSRTSTYILEPKKDSALANIIVGILDKQDWQTIRVNLDKNEQVKSGSRDAYLLPNEETYDQLVRSKLGVTLDARITITDLKTGNVVEPDQYNRY